MYFYLVKCSSVRWFLIYVIVAFSAGILSIITAVTDRQFRAQDILALFQVQSELLCAEKEKVKLCTTVFLLLELWFDKHNSVF